MKLHFLRPEWLVLLLPAFCYLAWVIVSFRQHNPWKKVCDAHLLPALVLTNPHKWNSLFIIALVLLYSLGIFALAGPTWKKTSLPVYRDISSLMLVLDLSKSMYVNDLNPDRLTRAKYKIRDLINASQNTQMGLVVFTQEAFTASPLSQDANTLDALLDELNPDMMPVSGAEINTGLEEGYKLLQQAGAPQGNLLLITSSTPNDNSFSAAKTIAHAGGHLNVLAMLDNNATHQETITRLQELAQQGHGHFYFFTPDASDIKAIVSLTNHKQATSDAIASTYLWQDAGPWFCLLLIPFALLVLRENLQHETH